MVLETSSALSSRADAPGPERLTAGAGITVEERFKEITDPEIRELIKNTTAGAAVGFRANAIGSARLGAYVETNDDAGNYEELPPVSKLSVFASKIAPLVAKIELDLVTSGRAFVWVNKVTSDVTNWELERLDPAAISSDTERHETAPRRDGVPRSERETACTTTRTHTADTPANYCLTLKIA